MSVEGEAKRKFESGYNCAESVLLTLNECFRFDASLNSCIPRIATGFGGGVGRNGDLCGALSGGIMAIGLALGRDDSTQSRDACYRVADEFYVNFGRQFGTCTCRELTGVDLKTPEGSRIHHERIRQDQCIPIVTWATKTAKKVIPDAGKYLPPDTQ